MNQKHTLLALLTQAFAYTCSIRNPPPLCACAVRMSPFACHADFRMQYKHLQ